MGTKLEYAINPLASSVNNSSSFNLHGVDDWDCLRNRGLKQNDLRTGLGEFHGSMDRMLEKHNIESIKKTMQMHEDIFKHQVRELHRLYSVQKMLMDELKKEMITQTRPLNPLTGPQVNYSRFVKHHPSTIQSNYGYHFPAQNLSDDPCARECSASCSGDTLRIPRGFDLERPAEEDISTGAGGVDEAQTGPSYLKNPKSTKMSTDGSDNESEVELTLSIGGSRSKKKTKCYQGSRELNPCAYELQESKQIGLSASFKPDLEEFSSPSTTVSSSGTSLDQERKRPHWLFQGLSLNRT